MSSPDARTTGVRVGAHVSAAGGLERAVANARAAGCEAFQVWASNPRTWALPPDDPARDERFRVLVAEAGLGPVFVHVPYLVNLASTNEQSARRSRAMLAATLARAGGMGVAGVVVHAGYETGGGRSRALAATRDGLLGVVGDDAAGPVVALELTADGKGSLASRFDQMAELLAACDDHPRLTVCLDTCHAHAAGYDMTGRGATATVDQLVAAVGGRVALVHANATREPRGSRLDRHWHVGEGLIGDDGFAAVLAHPGLAGAAAITETPGEQADHARNVARLKRLRAAGRPAPVTT
jgi:deoxyribonuclease IV